VGKIRVVLADALRYADALTARIQMMPRLGPASDKNAKLRPAKKVPLVDRTWHFRTSLTR